jgi:hypothetical protein
MSALEMVTLRQRAQEAMRQNATRGADYAAIPAGSVRCSDGLCTCTVRVILWPENQVKSPHVTTV